MGKLRIMQSIEANRKMFSNSPIGTYHETDFAIRLRQMDRYIIKN